MAIVSIVALGAFLCSPAPAGAEEAVPDPRPQPGPVALRAELGQVGGAAAGGEIRVGPAGLRLTAGANLILVIVTLPDSYALGEVEVFGSWQLNGELFLFPFRVANGNEIGFTLAARYNSLLGPGGGVGVEVRRQLRSRLGLSIGGGLTIYPDAEDRVLEEGDHGADVHLNDPFGVEAQFGATVGLNLDRL